MWDAYGNVGHGNGCEETFPRGRLALQWPICAKQTRGRSLPKLWRTLHRNILGPRAEESEENVDGGAIHEMHPLLCQDDGALCF